jgi:serine/threonine protein kinase
MTLATGTRLGTYEIIEPLGAGGMGEVYRAHDAKLKRDIAIKILPEEFSKDAERVSRFQREAEALAALNHQNIGAIYDLQATIDGRWTSRFSDIARWPGHRLRRQSPAVSAKTHTDGTATDSRFRARCEYAILFSRWPLVGVLRDSRT